VESPGVNPTTIVSLRLGSEVACGAIRDDGVAQLN